jgi:flagellar biosynthesis regulator FlaF
MAETIFNANDEALGQEREASRVGGDPELLANFDLIGQDARALIEAAEQISDADDRPSLTKALDHNLKLWVAIRAAVSDPQNQLPPTVKDNLRRLADYVAGVTFSAGRGELNERQVEALANINLRMAEGLTRGQQQRLIQERAYQIWEEEGRPNGRSLDHWTKAEQELRHKLGDAELV